MGLSVSWPLCVLFVFVCVCVCVCVCLGEGVFVWHQIRVLAKNHSMCQISVNSLNMYFTLFFYSLNTFKNKLFVLHRDSFSIPKYFWVILVVLGKFSRESSKVFRSYRDFSSWLFKCKASKYFLNRGGNRLLKMKLHTLQLKKKKKKQKLWNPLKNYISYEKWMSHLHLIRESSGRSLYLLYFRCCPICITKFSLKIFYLQLQLFKI